MSIEGETSHTNRTTQSRARIMRTARYGWEGLPTGDGLPMAIAGLVSIGFLYKITIASSDNSGGL